MKKFFILIAVAAMAFAAQANDWTAADGTDTGEYAPVYGYNYETDQHNQMQYPAAELTGLAVGTEITAMKFYTSTPDEVNALGGSVMVSLANIEAATAWSVDGYGYISGNLLDVAVTKVATVTPTAEEGVWTITFDSPFTYTGGALLVDVQTSAGDWNDTEFYGKEMGAYYAMSSYGYAGSKKGQTVLPKVTFVYAGGDEPEVLRGDVNKDGGVNIADVAALIDMLLNNEAMIPEADCDQDGSMNIADAAALVDFLLSGVWE